MLSAWLPHKMLPTVRGVEALVNNLRVITNPQSLTGVVQKPSPSVAPILRGSAAESSTAESIIRTTSRGIRRFIQHASDGLKGRWREFQLFACFNFSDKNSSQ